MEDERFNVGGGGSGRRSLRYEFSRESNGLTLGGILSIKETSSYQIQNHTLLDLIRDNPTSETDSKKSWKMFTEKLRLKLAGSGCTTAGPVISSHVHITTDNNRTSTTTRNDTNLLVSPTVSNAGRLPVANSTNLLISPPVSDTGNVPVTQTANFTNLLNLMRNTGSVLDTPTENVTNLSISPPVNNVPVTETVNTTNRLNSPLVRNTGSVTDTQTVNVRSELPVENRRNDDGDGGGTAETVKMSLMSLLEVEGSACFDDDEVVDDDGGGGGGYRHNNCCVCMVRDKGAAFIPCGHTFCRVCSRELFVKRASCPLCNHFISEILDIF